MTNTNRLEYVVLVVLVVLLVPFLFGAATGHPSPVAYTTADSMSPTLAAGDGFVALPPWLAGEVGPGDVVVFESDLTGEGELVTHRIVEETDEGFITQGDAVGVSDQARGEAPVTKDRIRAVALQVGGSVVRIPHLGTVEMTIVGTMEAIVDRDRIGIAHLLVGVLGVGGAVVALRGIRRSSETRNGDRPGSREDTLVEDGQ